MYVLVSPPKNDDPFTLDGNQSLTSVFSYFYSPGIRGINMQDKKWKNKISQERCLS